MSTETRTMQVRDLTLKAGDLQFAGDSVKSDDGGVTTPVKLTVRTQSIVGTWAGRMVHDLKGVFHNEKIPLDWIHDDDHPSDIIGFIDKVKASNESVECSGQIVSLVDMDIADQVVRKLKAGIPFESSISFGGQGLEFEEVGENTTAKVNGQDFDGPGFIVRKWPLRGVAVCPHGADNSTSTSLALSDKEVPVLVTINKEKQMSEKQTLSPGELKAQEEKEKELVEKKATEGLVTKGKEVESNNDTEKVGKDFIAAFGTDGAVWFAEGKTFSEARDLYVKKLLTENEELKDRIATANLGDIEVAEACSEEEENLNARTVELSGKIGPRLAKFAAGLKIKK